MKLSKITLFSILLCTVCLNAISQTAIVQDFTRTNRLSGRPAVPDGTISGPAVAVNWSATLNSGGTTSFTPAASPSEIFGTALTYGGYNCEGSVWAINMAAGGQAIGSWVRVGASNTGNGNDGGSGMWNTTAFTFPMVSGASYVSFKGGGCHGGIVNVFAYKT